MQRKICGMFLRSGKKAVLDGSISKLAELSNKNPDGILGVSVYNNPEDIYYYIAVSSNIPVPEGMVEYMIPEGMWVVFENDGVFKEDVQSVFSQIFDRISTVFWL